MPNPLASNRLLVTLIVLVALGWLAFAAFGASTGLFLIDELIYQGMIDAFARHGSLAIENGYAGYQGWSLQLLMLVDSGGRLMPQYPSGWAIVASPAYGWLGLRGVLLLNAAASVATLALAWVAARALLDDVRLASAATLLYAVATYAVDYALGLWPHALSTCLVTAAFAAAAVGWRSEGRQETTAMLVAGLALGLAVNVRADAALAIPPLALWALATFRRPYRALLGLAGGLAPGMLAAAALNLAKFGLFSPITYGKRGAAAGATSIGYYAPLFPVAALLAVVALSLGFAPARRLLLRPASLALALPGVIVAAALVPGVADICWRVLTGLYVLVVDMQAYSGWPIGVELQPDGTVRFWGLAKKALLQSAPYLAGTLVLGRLLFKDARGAPLWLCVLFCALWALPFAYGQWHGGLSNNQRYLLPMLPALCILAVASWRELAGPRTDWRIVGAVAASAVLVAAIGPQHAGYPAGFAWQNPVPRNLAVLLAGLSLVLLLEPVRQRWPVLAVSVWRGVFVACLGSAIVSAYGFDLAVSQQRRAEHAANVVRFADLPANALVVSFVPEAAGFRLNAPPAMTAQADYRLPRLDARLIRYAFESGHRVFVQGDFLADLARRGGLADEVIPRYGIAAGSELFELRLSGRPADR